MFLYRKGSERNMMLAKHAKPVGSYYSTLQHRGSNWKELSIVVYVYTRVYTCIYFMCILV